MLFSKKRSAKIPKECEGLEIRTESSICTGETTIGFYEPRSKKLLYRELVRTPEDMIAFYERYGLDYKNDK